MCRAITTIAECAEQLIASYLEALLHTSYLRDCAEQFVSYLLSGNVQSNSYHVLIPFYPPHSVYQTPCSKVAACNNMEPITTDVTEVSYIHIVHVLDSQSFSMRVGSMLLTSLKHFDL